MPASAFSRLLDRASIGYPLYAALVGALKRPGVEWRSSAFNQALLDRPEPEGLAARPRDLRPADPEAGRRILAGGFVLGGETLAMGPRGDPWDRPSPSRRFAAALHGFGWLKDLNAHGDPGAWEALRLTLAWRRLFGEWNRFAWEPRVLERRTFNQACAIAALIGPASDAEADQLGADLARQARYLLSLDDGPMRAAERAVVAAVAGAALGGRAGEALLDKALKRLPRRLAAAVKPDGSHASRSPQAALELFFDLQTLDDALAQLGVAAPWEMMQALDRLAGAVRFFTLADGRLAAFQGGEGLDAHYVAAARAGDVAGERELPPSCGGYHRIEGRALQVMVDADGPATGAWSLAACGQPLALEMLAGGKRLVVGSGWSPTTGGPQALRLADAASCACLGETACGSPLAAFPAQVLGPRLRDAYAVTEVNRQVEPGAQWLEAAQDGWVYRYGLIHKRKLYLNGETDEVRGEDSLIPLRQRGGAEGRRFIPFVVRFHLAPQVSALIARDKKSVLIKAEGEEAGWWLRNDALDVSLEPSVVLADGQARHSQQIVLRGQARLDGGAKLRWKLSPAHDRVESRIVEGAAAPAPVDVEEGAA
ncbi:MAG: heparinase II/III family protein [Proteobacteria bacterium]|nr:heparinase II/III family protein [Pseudomonadota bacterium]